MAMETPRVDVVLQWKDFRCALEQLRHNEDHTTNNDRDWFQVNPIETVLLACHALGAGKLATRALASQVTLGLEDLSCQFKCHPRLFKRLVDVVIRTVLAENVTPQVRQRFVEGLHQLLIATRKQLGRLQVLLWTRLVPVSSKLLAVLADVSIANARLLEDDLNRVCQELTEANSSLLADGPGFRCELLPGVSVRSLISWQLDYQCRHVLQERSDMSVEECLDLFSNSLGVAGVLSDTLALVAELPAWRTAEICGNVLEITACLALDYHQLVVQEDEATGTATSETQAEAGEEEEQKDGEDQYVTDSLAEADTSAQDSTNDVASPQPPAEDPASSTDADGADTGVPASSRCRKLLAMVLRAAKDLGLEEDGLVVQKLLDICIVLLAGEDFLIGLRSTEVFLESQLQTLVVYAQEGYLTQSPSRFLCHLLEFICTSVENSRSPTTVLNSDLPNVFGPVFGVRNSTVSELVLEFASLSLYSKHQKELRATGIAAVLDAYRMIKPQAYRQAEQMKEVQVLEAVNTAHSIVSDILGMVDSQLEARCSAGHSEGSGGADADADVVHRPLLQWQPSILDAPQTVEVYDETGVQRVDVLVAMLRLACALVSSGENIAYLYRSVVPKLVQEVPSSFSADRQMKLARFFGDTVPKMETNIPWGGDRKVFLVRLFSLAADFVQKTHRSVFHLCAVAVPKLAAGLGQIQSLGDSERWDVLAELLSVTQEALHRSQSIDVFITHGLDILTDILPSDAVGRDVIMFARNIAQKFTTASNSSSLMLARLSFASLLQTFPEDADQVRSLMRALVKEGSRSDLRAVHKLCRVEFGDDRYRSLKELTYSYATGMLTSRQLQAMSDIVSSLMSLCPAHPKQARHTVTEEEEWQSLLEKHNRRSRRMNALASPIIADVKAVFTDRPFSREKHEKLSKDVSNLALFAIVFPEVLEAEESDVSEEEDARAIASFLADHFPVHVVEDAESQAFLQSYVSRLEHMQTPRYGELQKVLKTLLREYLASAREEHSLSAMQTFLSTATRQLPQNVSARARLARCGYSERLWDTKSITTVTTDGTLSLEENLRQNLLRCYDEYAELLKLLHVTHVEVNGEQEKVVDLFDDRLSLTDLRGRRTIAARCIDRQLSKTMNDTISHRKLALLSREEQLELDYEKQLNVATSPKRFTVCLNTSLYDCCLCCGRHIIGCYAPTGEHAERPLEIGMRVDSAIASIYDEKGLEIENCEMVFADEGAIVYKAYSNGHPYDTSQVWGQFFQVMLAEPALVPALIIPSGFPNTQTWILLQRIISPVEAGGHINCSFDFCPDWRTYLDSRPERIRCGIDIVLPPNFSVSTGAPRLQRQSSIVSKDLAGLVFADLIRVASNDDSLKEFRFLGKSFALGVSALVQGGSEGPREILSKSFNYARYASASQLPAELLPSKEDIVERLAGFIESSTAEWCLNADAAELFASSRGNFFDLKRYLEQLKAGQGGIVDKQSVGSKLGEIRSTLEEYTLIVDIDTLLPAAQEELIRWIFANEDRVWRYRGGRDRLETLDQFFNFLPHRRKESGGKRQCYPGVVTLCLRTMKANLWKPEDFQVDEVVAYAIGEFTSLESSRRQAYEIVTAFVQPRFRGLRLAVRMYISACINSRCSYLLFDMVEGSFEKIVSSNTFLLALERSGMLRYGIQRRQQSYEVVDQTGHTEQFEVMIMNAWYLRFCLQSYSALGWLYDHPVATASLMMLPATTALGGMWLWRQWRR